MKIRKSVAGIAAGTLAVAGLAVATAPAAQAATGGPYTLSGSPANEAGTANYGGTPTVTLTAVQTAIDTAVITASISQGPTTTSFAGFNANEYRLDAYVRIDGGPQIQLTGVVGTTAVPPSTVSYPSGTTATATVTGLTPGVKTIVLQSLVAEGSGSGSGGAFATNFSQVAGFDAIYNFGATTGAIVANPPTSPIGLTETVDIDARTLSVDSTSGQATANYGRGAGSFDPDGPGPAPAVPFGGQTVTLGFNDQWGAGSATVELCDASSTTAGCQALPSVTLTGGVAETKTVVLGSGLTTGLRNLVVTDPVNSAKKKTAAYNVLGARTMTITPASGGPGQAVAISGANWNTGESVAVGSIVGAPTFAATADTGTGTVNGTGALTGSITVNNPATFAITVNSIAQAPQGTSQLFTVNADTCNNNAADGVAGGAECTTKQNIEAIIQGGVLSQTAADQDGAGTTYTSTSIKFGTVTTAVSSQTLNRVLNPITVADARGGSAGWSLTASMPALTNGSTGSIAAANLAVSGQTCVANAPGEAAPPNNISATGNTAGSAGNFGSPSVTLCNKNSTADSAGDTSGGQYLVNANLALTIPAFQQTGTYTSTITVTLT
jgi:hypothetical protein